MKKFMDVSNHAYVVNKTKAHMATSIKTLIIFTVIALVAVLSFFANPRPTYADGSFCQLGNGGPCQEVFAVGSGNQPLTEIVNGPGASYVESVLRAYVFTGTEGQEADKYMLFHMTVTINPDPNDGIHQYVTNTGIAAGSPPDTSSNGSASTMQAGLWSAGFRNANCAVGATCIQSNYPGLELNNYCNPNGGSQSYGLSGIPVGGGASVSWGITSPTYDWCTTSPASDIYSHYYNYQLEDFNQLNAQITEDFVFAQWQQSSNPAFKIGYSVITHLARYNRVAKVQLAGPSITRFATYQV
jgi:hypothetical protein